MCFSGGNHEIIAPFCYLDNINICFLFFYPVFVDYFVVVFDIF